MTDLFENPMGLMGFEFVEFASPTPDTLELFFEKLGFELVAKHRSKDVVLYRQGDINFIVNREPNSPAACLTHRHRDGHDTNRRVGAVRRRDAAADREWGNSDDVCGLVR
jgi:4-hydroxyphenylpyruvate dioxygenase-like putative hemolysin